MPKPLRDPSTIIVAGILLYVLLAIFAIGMVAK